MAIEENYNFFDSPLEMSDKVKLLEILGNEQFSILKHGNADFERLRELCCDFSAITIGDRLKAIFDPKEKKELDSDGKYDINMEVYDIFMTVIDEKTDKQKKTKEYKMYQNIEYKLKLRENWREYLQFFKLILLAKVCKMNNICFYSHFIYRFYGFCYNDVFANKVLSYIGFSQGRKQKRYLEHLNGNTTNSRIVLENCDRNTIRYVVVRDLSQYNFADYNMKKHAQEVEDEMIRLERKGPFTCVNSNNANVKSEYIKCDRCGNLLKKSSLAKHRETKKCQTTFASGKSRIEENIASTKQILKEFLKPTIAKQIPVFVPSSFAQRAKENTKEEYNDFDSCDGSELCNLDD